MLSRPTPITPSAYLAMEHVLLFATGWKAPYPRYSATSPSGFKTWQLSSQMGRERSGTSSSAHSFTAWSAPTWRIYPRPFRPSSFMAPCAGAPCLCPKLRSPPPFAASTSSRKVRMPSAMPSSLPASRSSRRACSALQIHQTTNRKRKTQL